MKKVFFTLIAAALFISPAVLAQTCPSVLASKNGNVLSAAPGILKTTPSANEVTVKVRKTGGRAETQVNIYVNGQYKEKIEFDNGNYSGVTKTKKITGTQNKEVKIEIVNQSVANSFEYSASIDGEDNSLMPGDEPATGNLLGQTEKTVSLSKSCTNKGKIIIRRVDGNARATIRLFNGSTILQSVTFEAGDNMKELTYNSSSSNIKVELKNISVGNTLKYKINATVN